MQCVLLLPDQLSKTISSIRAIEPNSATIFLVEFPAWLAPVAHHKKKLALLISAMRHFAKHLQDCGYHVIYQSIDHYNKQDDVLSLFQWMLAKFAVQELLITHASEYHIHENILNAAAQLKMPLKILDDDRFLSSMSEFKAWASDRKSLRMEYFYRHMRRQYHILMQDNEPVGGQWNYDADNRASPDATLHIPEPFKVTPDRITQQAIEAVEIHFNSHFGELKPFHMAVTHEQAKAALLHFIHNNLKYFGRYQDAMLADEVWMFHAHISFYLNCGLLLPLECVQAAEQAYRDGLAPLNSVEGFIRQIIGWREFVRGIYWLKMPSYEHLNFFNANRSLPHFYWDANTDMQCIKQCVKATKAHAYAHHIQRLMVLGNFALLAGINPKAVNHWFWVVYADAYQWVELPNVSGMVLFADGGFLASKPYAAGGSYINKMSNYCKQCRFNVKLKQGESACPFNYLYWDFLSRNRDKLQHNPRIAMMYRTYDRMSDEKKSQIKEDSEKFLMTIADEKK